MISAKNIDIEHWLYYKIKIGSHLCNFLEEKVSLVNAIHDQECIISVKFIHKNLNDNIGISR